jgi:AcrR family transcriptional regulator
MLETDAGAVTRPYHHGDLQRAIVDAALDVLKESQSTEFSLRELARRAGVSHNAPYKHFADKQDLLASVSAAGFDKLAAEMSIAQEGLESPRDRLAALLRAYLDSGIRNPALYRLMFGGLLTDKSALRPAVEMRAAAGMKNLLVDAISAGALECPKLGAEEHGRWIDGVLLFLWAQLHGLTLLLIDGLVGPSDRAALFCETMLKIAVDGLTTCAPTLPEGLWVGPRGAQI